jgi:hypothetical protein
MGRRFFMRIENGTGLAIENSMRVHFRMLRGRRQGFISDLFFIVGGKFKLKT